MMKTILLFTVALLASLPAMGQLQDDFSDGDFTSMPEWLGQTEKFTVQNEILQLLDENPGSNNSAYLYTPALTSNNETTTWEFWVNLEFAPSSSNFARIYLNASSPNLDAELNGYFLQVGGISGSDDALELHRQDGNSSTLLLSGTTGAVGSEPVLARVQITRTTGGEWALLADYAGGTDYQNEGVVTDDTYPMGGFFGFYCEYTSTRADAFFYDDVLVDPLFVDTEPPALASVQADNSTTVLVSFNEPVNIASAENTANYSINNGIGSPASATLSGSNPTQVELSLSSPLENAQMYTLTTNNIEDAEGNAAGEQSLEFTFFNIQPAAAQDVIISELMPDPNPQVGLPEGEYIELYNRSDKVIELSSLFFSSGSTPVQLPDYLLLPDSYVAVVDADLLGEYSADDPIVGLNSFPALTNGGDDLTLTNESEELIFALSYSDSWYGNEERADGGYSLEVVQLDGPYGCAGNWAASQAAIGGTPGLANSWLGQSADEEAPFVMAAFAESEFEVFVQFSEQMDLASITNPGNYTISNGITVESANFQGNDQVLLSTSQMLETGIRYELTINTAVTDCIGNAISDETFPLGVTEPAEALDFVLNEVLFDPLPQSFDFIELYNRSDKAINLNGLTIVNAAKESGDTIGMVEQDYILFPEAYVVITEEPSDILNQYMVQNPRAFIQGDLPTLDNDEGNVTLRLNEVTIDSFDYEDDYHYQLLDDEEGVSLERLSPESNTQDAGNWHSAAATVGFATPTYENSQFFPTTPVLDETISLPNNTFSPDGDGFEDVLLINYLTDGPGYTLNLRIFDSNGREVRQLLNNELLGSSGTFQWDGTTTEPSKARIGIYVLWFELFQPDGKVERGKKVCVLAGQLD